MAEIIPSIWVSATTDAAFMAAHMRERDREEVLATIGRDGDVEGTIRGGIVASRGLCWTVCDRAAGYEPIFVIGCTKVANGVGSPWLLATDKVQRIPGTLTKITKSHIPRMLKAYGLLVNCVDARNVDSLRWLRRLGFTVDAPEAYGAEGRMFHRFHMGA